MEALPRLGMALVLLTGGLLAIDGRVAVGDIVAFNAYVLIMAAPFRMIGFVLIQWQRPRPPPAGCLRSSTSGPTSWSAPTRRR